MAWPIHRCEPQAFPYCPLGSHSRQLIEIVKSCEPNFPNAGERRCIFRACALLNSFVQWKQSTMSKGSPSSRGRGSKHPRAGVIGHGAASPSSRGRGSKRRIAANRQRVQCRPLHEGVDRNFDVQATSIKSIGRPLHEGVDRNQRPAARRTSGAVALFTRAWIETYLEAPGIPRAGVALFTRAWIETAYRLEM